MTWGKWKRQAWWRQRCLLIAVERTLLNLKLLLPKCFVRCTRVHVKTTWRDVPSCALPSTREDGSLASRAFRLSGAWRRHQGSTPSSRDLKKGEVSHFPSRSLWHRRKPRELQQGHWHFNSNFYCFEGFPRAEDILLHSCFILAF